MITDAFGILIVQVGVIAAALTLAGRFQIARKISPVILILFFSALLSNMGVIPTEHWFYARLSGYAIPFAVCLMLLHIGFARIKKTGLPMLGAFAVASLGSTTGCLVSGVLLHNRLDAILDGQGWKLAGPYIGTYIGGSLNFFSMWSGLEIDNPELLAAANAIDNLTLIPIFIFWVVAPKWLNRFYPNSTVCVPVDAAQSSCTPICLKADDWVKAAFIALLAMAGGDLIKKYCFASWFPQLPTILIVTTLALAAAQFKKITSLQGAQELGNIAFYLFFACIGAMMDIPKAVCLAPVLFLYVLVVIASQIVFVLAVGRLLRMDIRMLAVASLAAKAGPSTAAAYTHTKGWNDLTLPGVAAALLGYAIGNYAGLAGAYLLKAILGAS